MDTSRQARPAIWPFVIAFLMGLGCWSREAWADMPIQWKVSDGGNDHYYQFVDFGENTSWTTARDYAASQNYLGLTGHLLTESSEAEDNFIRANFGSYIGDPNTAVPGVYAWIGLTDENSTGSYRWITGEPLTFTNWAPPEPNFLGYEHYGHLWTRKFTGTDVDSNGTPLWSWNNAVDAPFGADPSAYRGAIIEFNSIGPNAVPEPSAFLICLLASTVFLGLRIPWVRSLRKAILLKL